MRNKFLGFICLVYSFIIGYAWIFDKLKNYLALQMQSYIKISLFPLIILGIGLIISKNKNKFKISDIVLLIPIIFLFISGDGRLDVNFASNRLSDYNGKKSSISENKTKSVIKENDVKNTEINDNLEYKNNNMNIDLSNIKYDIVDEAYNELAIYFSFDPKSVKHAGETIKIRGFAVNNESYIPDGYFMLGKYVITCCAADSSFIGYPVKMGDFKIQNGGWYEIEGVLEETGLGDKFSYLAINAVNIKSIDKNTEEQYVYQCFAYDKDGSCKKLQEYDMN